MKRILITAAVAIAIVVAVVQIADFFHVGDKHERTGHFDIYTSSKAVPDLSVSSALYDSRRRLTDHLTAYSVDPNNPDRIIFSSDDVYHAKESVCGTFYYDRQAMKLIQLRPWPYAGRSPITWSPDSRYLLIDRVTVRELLTGHEIDLGDYISKKDGQRPDLEMIQWSPDNRKLAARLGPIAEAGHRDEDLIEITVSPVSFRYVASIRDASLVWTDKQIQWAAGNLEVVTPAPTDRPIIVKPAEELAWVAASPTIPAPPPIHEGYCSFVEVKK